MKKLFLSIVLGLAGCQTPYTQIGALGGVEAIQISADIYGISARGNGFTNTDRVAELVILKAAETTLSAGKSHFQWGPYKDASSKSLVQGPTFIVPVGPFTSIIPGGIDVVDKPGVDILIRVTNDGNAKGAWNAQAVVAKLAPKLRN